MPVFSKTIHPRLILTQSRAKIACQCLFFKINIPFSWSRCFGYIYSDQFKFILIFRQVTIIHKPWSMYVLAQLCYHFKPVFALYHLNNVSLSHRRPYPSTPPWQRRHPGPVLPGLLCWHWLHHLLCVSQKTIHTAQFNLIFVRLFSLILLLVYI